MATSSIFHTVQLNTPEKAEAFVAALEASVNDPWVRPEHRRKTVETDANEIRRLHEMRRRNRERVQEGQN